MTLRTVIARITSNEDINFLLTNRIPRQWLTRFMGWFSKIEQPLVRDVSIAIWKLFSDLDLSEARKSRFRSMHDCFIRELREGAREIDQDTEVLVSPCDAIVGASGLVNDTQVLQAKGFPYSLLDLLGEQSLVEQYRNGCYVTLRLTSSMYHRFHAPYACRVEQVNYLSGDTWNVNPIALKRIEKLFCKNERAVIQTRLTPSGQPITLVPVAAVLVASIRLHFLDVLLHLKYRGPNLIRCDASFAKGQEMGWFEHGSTIIVFAPSGFTLAHEITEGHQVRMGQPLLTLPLAGSMS
ncbi:MAG: archaetidylserine decarboxylase [Steroidobacteraceae bacterium]